MSGRRAAAVALCLAAVVATGAGADPGADPVPERGAETVAATVEACLACHRTPGGQIDIVGLAALDGLPEEWPFLFEDQFDLDDDGIAGAMRFVSGPDGPRMGRFGSALAAGRFEDFALIAAAAHAIPIDSDATLAALRAAFYARSPDPDPPTPAALTRFEARGCAACHVTRSFEQNGRRYWPLSDFLLHDLGAGPKRTQPLWGCAACLEAPGHK